MKIALAQTRPVKGDIDKNIGHHLRFVQLAVESGAGMIVFPELSLTGYEPEMAALLAINTADTRLNVFQQTSDAKKIIIGAGVPVKTDAGIHISMIIFQPGKPRQIYSKQYLHADEEPFFAGGSNNSLVTGSKQDIAPAICYEINIPAHAAAAVEAGAKIYIASVAKSATGVESAIDRLSAIARQYTIPVLMANSIGYCDNFESAGGTAAWNNEAVLTGQLDDKSEGMIIFDTDTAATNIITTIPAFI